jgi:hypothetical protein
MPNENQVALSGLKMPELKELEDKVRRGLASFVEVGKSLQLIEDKRGYILRGYKDFAAYCEGEFHFSLRQGQRLMLAAQTAVKVEKAIGEAPRNEASARVLNPIATEPKLLERVKKELEKKKLNVATATAEVLQEVVDKVRPKTESMFAEERPKPPAVIAGLSDVCPVCKRAPNLYHNKGDHWMCGACNASVRIGALSLEIAICKECKAPIVGDAGFCAKCGTVQ